MAESDVKDIRTMTVGEATKAVQQIDSIERLHELYVHEQQNPKHEGGRGDVLNAIEDRRVTVQGQLANAPSAMTDPGITPVFNPPSPDLQATRVLPPDEDDSLTDIIGAADTTELLRGFPDRGDHITYLDGSGNIHDAVLADVNPGRGLGTFEVDGYTITAEIDERHVNGEARMPGTWAPVRE